MVLGLLISVFIFWDQSPLTFLRRGSQPTFLILLLPAYLFISIRFNIYYFIYLFYCMYLTFIFHFMYLILTSILLQWIIPVMIDYWKRFSDNLLTFFYIFYGTYDHLFPFFDVCHIMSYMFLYIFLFIYFFLFLIHNYFGFLSVGF